LVLATADAKAPVATYKGKRQNPDRIEGALTQQGRALPLNLVRLATVPVERANSFGADSVWNGTLNLVVKKLDFRIRVYSSPPFATEESPRVLFDSLSERAVGLPATVAMDQNRTATFEIPIIKAKFTGKLNEAGNELSGSFLQGPVPLPLVMKLQEYKDDSKTSSTATDAKKKEPEGTSAVSNPALQMKELEPAKAKVDRSVPAASNPSAPYVETEFEVVVGTRSDSNLEHSKQGASASDKPRAKAKKDARESGHVLSGTLTLPKQSGRVFPAVVMVTGSGPQDRNESIGKHKPFQVLAHFLATQGIASLRYDDRGIGKSTGDFATATSEDFARDAIAVWEYARTLSSIDRTSIGILGHSEGGIIGPMVATWQPEIAFLILLAPPGVSGAEVLKSQIGKISELQGVSEADRKETLGLQDRLQRIAAGYVTDDASMTRDIREAIRANWPALERVAKAQDPTADTSKLRDDLTAQIEAQAQQLRSPWAKFFLNHDPASHWILIRCPVLAIWGSKDVQVLPEVNRDRIEQTILRNRDAKLTAVTLPGLNHLMQRAQSGMPDEYDVLSDTIAPSALETIRDWCKQQGLVR
jgi:pimeloyl-ACP methyl ester carboxylesterase